MVHFKKIGLLKKDVEMPDIDSINEEICQLVR